MNPSVVIYGPQGSGKTRNAEKLREYFGLFEVFEADEARRDTTFPRHGALILTSDEGFVERLRETGYAHAYPVDVALSLANQGADTITTAGVDVAADRVTVEVVEWPTCATSAPGILKAAADHLESRAALRDQPQGERSMARTVAAFNALTGHQVSERDGWLFMAVLKAARACTTPAGILDDYQDGAAYFGLAGESALKVAA